MRVAAALLVFLAPCFAACATTSMELVLIEPGHMQVAVFQPACPAETDPKIGWTAADLALCRKLAAQDASPGFPVTIAKPFYIGKFEVTQAEWTAVMGKNPSVFQRGDNAGRRPVENVTWQDAQAFIKKLNELEKTHAYRLPTEFEWEYAGRAGGAGQVGWTDIRQQAVQGLRAANGVKPTTQPVGSKLPNAWGLYDMLGNVWEWVEDYYNEKTFPDPVPPMHGTQHVLKGAGFVSDVKNAIYATHGAGPGDGWDVGFRVVKEVEQAPVERASELESSPVQFDPALLADGQQTFGTNCGFCHGAKARGGAQGGPDLTQSQLVRADRNGKQLGAFLKVGRPDKGMPAFALSDKKVEAISTFLHSTIASIPRRRSFGADVLVGDAKDGKAFFDGEGNCSKCHAAAGDLKGIGAKYPPAVLQGRLVLPLGNGGYPGLSPAEPPRIRVRVVQPDGKTVSGMLVFLSDYAVTLIDSEGERHTLPRHGEVPKIVMDDPLQAHLDRQSSLTDKQMHDLTAYLATLK